MKYENVDLVIGRYFSYLPNGNSFFDTVPRKVEQKEQYEIKKFLIEKGIIKQWNNSEKHIITKLGEEIVTIHKGIEKYLEFETKQQKQKEELEKIKNQKLYFDAKISKWKYYTFWWLFALAILGGGYSIYDIIERLTKSKPKESRQNPRVETESELSKSHTLILDQKNLDSSHNSKTQPDSSKTN